VLFLSDDSGGCALPSQVKRQFSDIACGKLPFYNIVDFYTEYSIKMHFFSLLMEKGICAM